MSGIWIKRLMGGIAFLVGLGLAVWLIYNQIWPTKEYRANAPTSLAQIALPVVCLMVGWKWMRYEGKSITEVSPPDMEDPLLGDWRGEAHFTMGRFLAYVDEGGDGAFIKFPLATPKGLTEHIWGYVHFYKDGAFNVSLANEPVDESQSADGRRNVPMEDVEDWQIVNPDGSITGGYSLMALFRYHEARGLRLTPLMRKEKAQLRDI